MYSPKGIPFMYAGCTDVSDCSTVREVMKKANLDWDVAKVPISTAPADITGLPNLPIDNYYATIRTDNGKPLGLVKNTYEIVQNVNAFDFFDAAIGKEYARWDTAGCYNDGNKVFVSAKLPNTLLINDNDPVENYLVFTTSHDGTSGVKILFTPIRLRCFNMLSAAVSSSSAYINLRHTRSVHSKLDIVADIVAICTQKAAELDEVYNRLARTKISEKDAISLFANTVLTEEELLKIKNTGHTIEQIAHRDNDAVFDAEISTRKVNIISEMNEYYFSGVAQKDIYGTAWGAYNAVSGFYCNVDNATGQKRMDSLLFGDKSRKIEKATKLILTH